MSRILIFCLVALWVSGCAHGMTHGPFAAQEQSSDSNDSSQSNDSDQSSNSDDMNGSSKDSNNEATEQDSNDSSDESTEDSTDDTSSKGEDQMSNAPVLTTAGVAITGLAVGVVIWLNIDDAPPAQVQATAEVTRRWLAANAHQLAIDLALGAGPAIADLAGAAGISPDHQRAFGSLLREHRAELLALCDPAQLTPTRALAFLERVGDLSRAHPLLAEDYQRFISHHRAPS
ncbi:MAG TPA: hypothetical protein VFG83_00750 [Kofleriaceae bacterium]|nr:hypothetical protein [Kofleriaceae bacterium]